MLRSAPKSHFALKSHFAPKSRSVPKSRSALSSLATRGVVALHKSSLLQIGVLSAFWFLGETLARLAHLPLPGGVVGMVVVLALLAKGWIRPASVRRGAAWLLAEMLLFFVPAVMAVIDHPELVGVTGLKIFGVILLGTVMVMGGTALTIDLMLRWRAGRMAEACHAEP